MTTLNNLPLATVLSLFVVALAGFLVVRGDIAINTTQDFLEFGAGIGVTIAGFAALGKIRNDAGHGL